MPYDLNLSQVLMTLSAIAYAGEAPLPNESLAGQQKRIGGMISAELANANNAAAGEWKLVWGPGLTVGNSMYVAQKTGTSDYAVVVRGTDWSFMVDWIENLDILQLVPIPYVKTTDPNVRIAKGTMEGLNDLTGMMAPAAQFSEQQPMSLLQYVNDVAIATPGDINVYVTGHSLGGCLASVLAVWLQFQTAQWQHTGDGAIQIVVHTFAAPSAGNQSFAKYCSVALPELYRVFNTLDIVPCGWQQLELPLEWYVPAPGCPTAIKLVTDGLRIGIAHDIYTQAGTPMPLNGVVDPNFSGSYWQQVAYQHDENTYLSTLGARGIDLTASAVVRAASGPNAFATALATLNPLRL